jgi:hypothetical protein
VKSLPGPQKITNDRGPGLRIVGGRAGSSQSRNTDGFGWCPVAEDVTGAVVELDLDSEQMPGRVTLMSALLGEVLAQQAVHVAFEPRCQGKCESQK